jgi:hypothetical protein
MRFRVSRLELWQNNLNDCVGLARKYIKSMQRLKSNVDILAVSATVELPRGAACSGRKPPSGAGCDPRPVIHAGEGPPCHVNAWLVLLM